MLILSLLRLPLKLNLPNTPIYEPMLINVLSSPNYPGMTLMAGTQLDLSGKGWECPNTSKKDAAAAAANSSTSSSSSNHKVHNNHHQKPSNTVKVTIITPDPTSTSNGDHHVQKDQRIKAKLSKQNPVEEQCSSKEV